MKNLDFKRISFALIVALMLPLCMSAAYVRGDVNNDSEVNVADVSVLISHILTGEPSIAWNVANVDASADGEVNVADVTFLIWMILDKGNTDPVRTFTVNGVEFRMIRVEPGTFTMGTNIIHEYGEGEEAWPPHQVTLTKAYYISETEVTWELWTAMMDDLYSNSGDQTPVNNVSVTECLWFCDRLEARTAKHFRLPTEAEWEFAARGGNQSRGYTYAGSDNIDEVAWYRGNSPSTLYLNPVAMKAPNELGLYDMTGNAYEWVEDYYYYYSRYPAVDPCQTEMLLVNNRVIRGGSIGTDSTRTEITSRDQLDADGRGAKTTLRLVYTAD